MQSSKQGSDSIRTTGDEKTANKSGAHSGERKEEAQKKHRKPSPLKNFSRGSKLLEQDGRKAPGPSSTRDYDMADANDRDASFENFPKQHLISKLLDSGYFYSGEDDKTICHSCKATVSDWNEKDDPSVFHEAHCNYHHTPGAVDETTKQPLEGASLLDTPITDANLLFPPPVLLQPTIARTSPLKVKRNFSYTATPMHQDVTHINPGPEHWSLPAEGCSKLQENKLPPTAQYLTFQIERDEVIDDEHSAYLKTLNLFAEEDRKKTFSVNDCWKTNTNAVLPYGMLASDGFFYLGNLDRTKCFSCGRVFSKWLRQDKIHVVHKMAVRDCRMVNGTETRNIPLQSFPTSRLSSLPAKQFLPETMVSNAHSSTSSFSAMDSNESALEISPVPLPMHEDIDDPQEATVSGSSSNLNAATSSGMNQPPYITMPGALTDPNHPRKSAGLLPFNYNQKQAANLVQIRMSSSLSDPHESAIAVSEKTQSPIIHQNMEFEESYQRHHISVPPSQEELSPNEMPLDLTTRQNSQVTGIVVPPAVLHQEVPVTHAVNEAMDQESYPIQVSAEENEEQPELAHPETSTPSHLGQTTLYGGATSSHSPRTVPPSFQEALPFATAAVTSQGQWAEVFPCLDPHTSSMSSTVARQETYDFSWAARGISFTDEMARAGFYSLNDGDRVKCWYCGGGAHHWTPQDDPWEEHAKLYPNCEYLLQQKGPDFVAEVSSRHQAARPPTPVARFRRSPSIASNSSESPYSSLEEVSSGPFRSPFFPGSHLRFSHRAPSPPRFVDPREQEARRKQMIQAALNSDLTVAAVEMGFDIKIIKKAIKRKVRSTDSPFPSQDALLDALLNPPEDSESSDSDDEGSSSAPPTSVEPGSEVAGTSQSLVNPFEGQRGEPSSISAPLDNTEELDPRKLEGKLREYEQEKRCKVCLDRDAEVVFVPCGHLCTCVQCANALRTCPLCRKRIQTAMKIYTS